MANVHNPRVISVQLGCECGWEGEIRDHMRTAQDDFTSHMVEMIHATRSPSWAAKHPDDTDGGNDARLPAG